MHCVFFSASYEFVTDTDNFNTSIMVTVHYMTFLRSYVSSNDVVLIKKNILFPYISTKLLWI